MLVWDPNAWRVPAVGNSTNVLAALVDRLMGLMAIGLGLPSDHFIGFIDQHTSALRILHDPDANWDAMIECLPNCSNESNPTKYAPVSAGQHLMEKFNRTQ